MMRKTGFLMGLAALLAACGNQPGVYDVPLAEAISRLEQADMDAFRKARQCGILIHFSASTSHDNAITWRVTSSGQEVLRFTVRLAAEGDGTRATIEIPEDPAGGEMYDGNKTYARPAVNQPLRPAIQELIDAAMNQRPYDVARLPAPANTDRVCGIQRAGLESGSTRFTIGDKPGMDARQSARLRAEEASQTPADDFDPSFGQPMDNAAGGW